MDKNVREYRRLSLLTILQALTALVVVVAVAAGLVLASDIVLTLVLAVLFGVFLTRVSVWISSSLSISYAWSLALSLVCLFLTVGVFTALPVLQIDQQIEKASEHLDEGLEKVRDLAEQSATIRSVVTSIPFVSETLGPIRHNDSSKNKHEDEQSDIDSPSKSKDENSASLPNFQGVPEPIKNAANSIGRIFTTTLGLIVNSMLIFFVGLFLAVSPTSYRDGVVQLVPPSRRERATQILNEMGDTLWRWLLGRFGSMLVTGVGAAITLGLIGVPMAITLGIITGLLTFIPNIGAAISLALAFLFALPQGGSTATLVVPAYLGLQLLESYVITPLIQKQQVSLPPALLISFQAIMGVLFGILGAAVASPLLAIGKVAVERLYIEDFLEA